MDVHTFPRVRPNTRPHITLKVYVPKADATVHSALRIVKGSGIVGVERDGDLIQLDFEGNMYGAENLREFGERVMHAADRSITRYPTVARITLARAVVEANFIELGDYDYHADSIRLHGAAEQAELDRWLTL